MADRAQPGALSEDEYERMLALLNATAKGRVFLAELSGRLRAEDTRCLFDALRSIEASLSIVRDQLRPEMIAAEIRRVAAPLGAEPERPAGEDEAGPTGSMRRVRTELMALAAALAAGGPRPEPEAPPEEEPAPAEA